MARSPVKASSVASLRPWQIAIYRQWASIVKNRHVTCAVFAVRALCPLPPPSTHPFPFRSFFSSFPGALSSYLLLLADTLFSLLFLSRETTVDRLKPGFCRDYFAERKVLRHERVPPLLVVVVVVDVAINSAIGSGPQRRKRRARAELLLPLVDWKGRLETTWRHGRGNRHERARDGRKFDAAVCAVVVVPRKARGKCRKEESGASLQLGLADADTKEIVALSSSVSKLSSFARSNDAICGLIDRLGLLLILGNLLEPPGATIVFFLKRIES